MNKPKIDPKALFNIGYGLYVLTTNDGKKDNGCIVNAIMQVTSNPLHIAVAVNKQNYSCETIRKTLKMNVNCLSVDTPYEVFVRFGFQSGRDVEKFQNQSFVRSGNGCAVLKKCSNSFFSLVVEQTIDLDTHEMFICSVVEAKRLSTLETMTYTYYQRNVKPKPDVIEEKAFVCEVCGYIYRGEELPPAFVCPVCKHDASAFELIQ